jgi:hypothetical protein
MDSPSSARASARAPSCSTRFATVAIRYVEPDYEARRRDAFFVAVNCTRAGGTRFCVSMDSGPRARGGYDLALTELLDEHGHRFVVEVGSERGAAVLAEVPSRAAGAGDIVAADAAVQRTAMGRSMETTDLRELLQANTDDPR